MCYHNFIPFPSLPFLRFSFFHLLKHRKAFFHRLEPRRVRGGEKYNTPRSHQEIHCISAMNRCVVHDDNAVWLGKWTNDGKLIRDEQKGKRNAHQNSPNEIDKTCPGVVVQCDIMSKNPFPVKDACCCSFSFLL